MSVRKSPITVLVLSVIVPGLGQIFNDEKKKGRVIFGSCFGLALLIYWFSGFNRFSIALALILLWSSAIVDAFKVVNASGRPAEFYYRRSYVVAMLLLVGPFAFPLLWQSPQFSRFARWTWTVVVVTAALMFAVTPDLIGWLIRH